MKRKGGLSDETTGVSSVIGIVLMVAITVILASMVGVFAFQFDQGPETTEPNFAPDTTFNKSLTGDGQSLHIEHASGKQIESEHLTVRIQGAETNQSKNATYVGNVFEDQIDGTYTAGTEITLNRTVFENASGDPLVDNEYLILENATVRIIWEDPDPEIDETYTVYRCEPEFPNCKRTS